MLWSFSPYIICLLEALYGCGETVSQISPKDLFRVQILAPVHIISFELNSLFGYNPPMAEKSPYRPAPHKRFYISPDPDSRERVQTLYATVQEMRRTIPFFAGVTLFGSLSKGKPLDQDTAAETDIDIFAFIDHPALIKNAGQFAKENEYFNQEVEGAVTQDRWSTSFWDILPKGQEELNIVSAEKYINDYLHYKMELDIGYGLRIPRRLHILPQIIGLSGDYSFAHQFQIAAELPTDEDKAAAFSRLIEDTSPLFCLDIGGGLKPYRAAVIDVLSSQSKSDRTSFWSHLRSVSIELERPGTVPRRVRSQYPRTFADAVHHYGKKFGML